MPDPINIDIDEDEFLTEEEYNTLNNAKFVPKPESDEDEFLTPEEYIHEMSRAKKLIGAVKEGERIKKEALTPQTPTPEKPIATTEPTEPITDEPVEPVDVNKALDERIDQGMRRFASKKFVSDITNEMGLKAKPEEKLPYREGESIGQAPQEEEKTIFQNVLNKIKKPFSKTPEQEIAKAKNIMVLSKEFGQKYSLDEIIKAYEVLRYKKPEQTISAEEARKKYMISPSNIMGGAGGAYPPVIRGEKEEGIYTTEEIMKAKTIIETSRLSGVSYSDIGKNYDNIIKQTGLNKYPEASSFLPGLAIMPLSAGVLAPFGVLTGFAGYELLSEIINGSVSLIKQEPWKFHAGKGLKDLLPEEANEQAIKTVEVIDFIGRGLIVRGIYKKSPQVFEALTKNFITEYKLPVKIKIPASKIASIFRTGEEISVEETDILKSLNLSGKEWRNAVKNGLEVETDTVKITSIIDKPYWAKVKSVFGIEPYAKTTYETTRGGVKFGVPEEPKGLLTDKLPPVTESTPPVSPIEPTPAPSDMGVPPVTPEPIKPVTPVTEPIAEVPVYKPPVSPKYGEPGDKYYIYDTYTKQFADAEDAKSFDVVWAPGRDFFVHKSPDVDGYIVSEGITGAKITGKEIYTSPEDAIEAIRNLETINPGKAENIKTKLDGIIDEYVKNIGKQSPRYSGKPIPAPEAVTETPVEKITGEKATPGKGEGEITPETPPVAETPITEIKPGEKVVWTPNADLIKKGYVPIEGVLSEQVKNTEGGIGWNVMKDNGDIERVWADRGTLTQAEKPVEPTLTMPEKETVEPVTPEKPTEGKQTEIENKLEWSKAMTGSKYFNIAIDENDEITFDKSKMHLDNTVEFRYGDHQSNGDELTDVFLEDLEKIGNDLWYEKDNFRFYSHKLQNKAVINKALNNPIVINDLKKYIGIGKAPSGIKPGEKVVSEKPVEKPVTTIPVEKPPVLTGKEGRETRINELNSRQANIIQQIGREIGEFKPIGRMNDVGVALGITPNKGVAISTPLGDYVFAKARVPSKEKVAGWYELYKQQQDIGKEVARLTVSVPTFRNNTIIGNKNALENAKELRDKGYLDKDEIEILNKLEEFWDKYPNADTGLWNKDKSLKPLYKTKYPIEYKEKPPVAIGKTGKIKTESGKEIEFQYGIFNVDNVVASHHKDLRVNKNYPAESQPRDRTKMASAIQADKIENNFIPEMLGSNPMAKEGAPVIDKYAIIRSGNMRSVVLQRIYEKGGENAQKYKQYLIDNAEEFGYSPSDVENTEKAGLFRVIKGEMSPEEMNKFVTEANVSSVAEMSATEKALSDAKFLADEMMEMFVVNDEGNINTAANRDFIKSFFANVVAPNEYGTYMTSNGYLNQAGEKRISYAIFVKAYEDPKLIERLSESTDDNIKNITNMLVAVAPKYTRINAAIKKGTRHKLSITKDMAQAAEKLSFLRDQSTTVEEYMSQTALFDDGMSDMAKDLLRIYDKFGRSAKKLNLIFNRYAELVDIIGDPNQKSLFGEYQKPTTSALLQEAVNTMEGDYVPLDILKAESERSAEAGKVTGQKTGEGEREGEGKPKSREEGKIGKPYVGKAYRVESGNMGIGRDATALDIVNFEADELGNDDTRIQALKVAKDNGIDLSKYNYKNALWVTDNIEDARFYLPEEERENGIVPEIDISPNSIVLATDYQGGYLVLDNYYGEETTDELFSREAPKKKVKVPKFNKKEIKIANATSRATGAVGLKAVVPRIIRNLANKNNSILDFGAGKTAIHAQQLKSEGYNIKAHEFGNNFNPNIHDINALDNQYDIVYGSNVLNVQSTENMLDKTLSSMAAVVKKSGRLIVNYPMSPRKSDVTVDELQRKLQNIFSNVKYIGNKNAPVFIAEGKIEDEYELFNRVMPESHKQGDGPPTGYADVGGYADIPLSLELPEIVELARQLMGGKYPHIKKRLQAGVLGKFKANKGDIDLFAKIFEDIDQATKTLAHEIGHLVDWLPEHELKRGNILGHIAALENYLKHFMPGKPGGEGPLTEKDKIRLRRIAEQLLRKTSVEEIDEEIRKELPLTPDDILNIWNSTASFITNKKLYDYIQRLDRAAKKSIVKEALKGIVPEELNKFNNIVMIKTGKKIKRTITVNEEEIFKKYQELIEEETRKRELLSRDQIMNELKSFSMAWKPFDPNSDFEFTKYRFSPVELYADAVSGLITNPRYLQNMAPHFYEAFFNYMEARPEVQKAWDNIQTLLRSGNAQRELSQRTRNGFREREEEYRKSIEMKKDKTSLLDKLGLGLYSRFYDVYKHLGIVGEKDIPAENNPRYAIERMMYSLSETEAYYVELKRKVLDIMRDNNITQDDIDEYLLINRVATERAKVANPYGWTPERAKQRIAEMDAQFPKLKEIKDNFRAIREEFFINKAEEADMYSPELMTGIKENVDYVTFDIVGHLEKNYGRTNTAHIYEQVGTFSPAGSPLTGTAIKDVLMMKSINKNIAKESVTEFWGTHFKDEIKDADKRWNGKWNDFVESKDPKMKLMIYMKHGELIGKYLPKSIVEAFEINPVEMMLFTKIARNTANPFKELFTGHSPGFFLFNIKRDYFAAVKQLPGLTATKFLPIWLKSLGAGMKSAFGVDLPEVKEMLKEGMLITVENYRGENPEDTMLEKQLKRLEIKPHKAKNIIKKPFMLFWEYLGNVGAGFERTTKLASNRYLKKAFPDMPIGIRRHLVITRGGSPNFLEKGTMTPILNNVLLYSNAQIQGTASALEAAKEMPGEYAWKTFKYNLLPKLIMLAAALGYLGWKLKAMMDRVSEYDKTNYTIYPIGVTPEGKAIYLREPQDETGRLVGGLLWKILNKDKAEYWTNLLDYMAGQAPTLHPMATVLWATVDYITGHNPYDHFRNRYAINERVFAGGGKRAHTEFMKWILNQSGGQIVYRFKYGDTDRVKTEFEKAIGYPIVDTTIGRFIKISDYGINEAIEQDRKMLEQIGAKTSLLALDGIQKILNDEIDDLTEEEKQAIAEKSRSFNENMLKAMAYKYGNVYMQKFMTAQSNKEKILILDRMLKDPIVNQQLPKGIQVNKSKPNERPTLKNIQERKPLTDKTKPKKLSDMINK